jgi:hypothetical protein
MGCNTSKEAVQSVEDSNTGASRDQQQSDKKKEQIVNNAVNIIPEIGKYNCTEYLMDPIFVSSMVTLCIAIRFIRLESLPVDHRHLNTCFDVSLS